MCTNNENVIVERHDLIKVTEDKCKHLYIFKHPHTVACTKSDSECGFILKGSTQELGDNITIKLCIDEDSEYGFIVKGSTQDNTTIKLCIDEDSEYGFIVKGSTQDNTTIKLCIDEDSEYGFIVKGSTQDNTTIKLCIDEDSEYGFIVKGSTQDNTTIKLCIDEDEYTDTGIHLHDVISTQDMHGYATLTGTCKGNQITVASSWMWWQKWLPQITDWKFTGFYVEYNLSENLVAKRK